MGATISSFYAADPNGDAGRRGVIAMLEQALADLRSGAQPVPGRAVLVLGWVDGNGLYIQPYAAGVDVLSAIGLLQMGQMELYVGGPTGGA